MNYDRNVVSLAVFNLFRGLATGGYMALFSAYMSRLGYSMSDIGVVVALSNIAGFLASPAMGYILEVYSSRLVSTITGLLAAFSLLIAAYTSDIVSLAISYSLFMLSFYFGQPARMTFLSRVVERKRLGGVVGVTSAVFTLARSIGPPVAGFIAGYYSYTLSFTILAALAAIGSTVFYLTSTEPTANSGERKGYGLLEPYKRILRPSRELAVLYLFVGVDRAAWMMWFPMLSAYLVSLGYDEATIGALLGLSNFIETLCTPIMGKLVDSMGASRVLALSEATAMLSALTLITAGNGIYYVVVSMVLIGLSISSWVPGYNVYVAKVYERIGETYATTNAIRSLSGIPAPYIGGVLQDTITLQAPLLASAVMLAFTTIVSLTTLDNIERLKTPQVQYTELMRNPRV